MAKKLSRLPPFLNPLYFPLLCNFAHKLLVLPNLQAEILFTRLVSHWNLPYTFFNFHLSSNVKGAHFVQPRLYFFPMKTKFTRALLYLLFFLLYFCRLERLVGVLRKRISDSGGTSVATIN